MRRAAANVDAQWISHAHVTSAVVFLDGAGTSYQGYVLSVNRRGAASDYGLPGGKIEPGESPGECAVRELQEETGYVVPVHALQFVHDRPAVGASGFVRVFRIGMNDVVNKVPRSASDRTLDLRWHTPGFLASQESFGAFNRALFEHLGLLEKVPT